MVRDSELRKVNTIFVRTGICQLPPWGASYGNCGSSSDMQESIFEGKWKNKIPTGKNWTGPAGWGLRH